MNWYALFVKTGTEEIVREGITSILNYFIPDNTCKILVPKREIIEYKKGEKSCVVKTLFPSYVLVGTNQILKIYEIIRANRGENIMRFLRTDDNFQRISQEEISLIISLINDRGLIGISDVFVENNRVMIIDGPLVNFKGFVKKINRRKGRAKIGINFLNRKCYIDISIRCHVKSDSKVIKNELLFK